MAKEEGIIEKTSRQKATVRVKRSTACNHCSSRKSCSTKDNQNMVIDLMNDLQAKPGDHVEITIPEGSLLKISFLVYLLPIIALLFGAISGEKLAAPFNLQPLFASIFGGFLGLAGTFIVIKMLDRNAKIRDKYTPKISRIIRSETPHQTDKLIA